MFFTRLFKAMFLETVGAVSGDSIFIDSPLSQEGVDQAETLSTFLESKSSQDDADVERLRKVLSGASGDSIIASSNLRRAIATTIIGLWPRLSQRRDRVHILSCLQECSRNVDTITLSKPKSLPPLGVLREKFGQQYDEKSLYVTNENSGNKPIRQKSIVRLKEFADWVFDSNNRNVVIAGGHSLYFRNFFRTFLPRKSGHPCKKKKMRNGGAVAFTLCRAKLGDETIFMIEEKSIKALHLGFEK